MSRLARELPVDSTVVFIVLIAALAMGAGGMLVAANNSSPTPTSSLTAVGPDSTLAPVGSTCGPGATRAVPGSPGPTVAPTPLPTTTPTVEPTATPTPTPTSLPPEALTGYVWPVINARISSPFGIRSGGFILIDGQPAHDAIDLATWCGDRIRAAHAGTVLYAGRKFDEFLGYSQPLVGFYDHISNLNLLPIVVVIDDGNGYRSVYVHLSLSKVGAGDVVKAGQTIGLEGATGHATGCHLHYELIRMDAGWQAVAPEQVDTYAPFVRERIDPLLVLPLRDPDAATRFLKKYGQPDESGLPFDPPPAGSPGY